MLQFCGIDIKSSELSPCVLNKCVPVEYREIRRFFSAAMDQYIFAAIENVEPDNKILSGVHVISAPDMRRGGFVRSLVSPSITCEAHNIPAKDDIAHGPRLIIAFTEKVFD
jgi:putative lipase involved disintegration of autophagic bodies